MDSDHHAYALLMWLCPSSVDYLPAEDCSSLDGSAPCPPVPEGFRADVVTIARQGGQGGQPRVGPPAGPRGAVPSHLVEEAGIRGHETKLSGPADSAAHLHRATIQRRPPPIASAERNEARAFRCRRAATIGLRAAWEAGPG